MKTVIAALLIVLGGGIAAVLSPLPSGANAQEAERLQPKPVELETEPTRLVQLVDDKPEFRLGQLYLPGQWEGNPGAHRLYQTAKGLLQLNTSTGETTLLARNAEGGLERTAIAAPANASGSRWQTYDGLGSPTLTYGGQQAGSFEIADGAAGTLLHDTRDGEIWQLEDVGEGKLAWASTDPDQPRPGQAYLGVSTEATESGVKITQVYEGTAAALVGLQVGDVIEKADETALKSGDDLRKLLRTKKPGETVKLRINRNGTTFTLEVTLGEYK